MASCAATCAVIAALALLAGGCTLVTGDVPDPPVGGGGGTGGKASGGTSGKGGASGAGGKAPAGGAAGAIAGGTASGGSPAAGGGTGGSGKGGSSGGGTMGTGGAGTGGSGASGAGIGGTAGAAGIGGSPAGTGGADAGAGGTDAGGAGASAGTGAVGGTGGAGMTAGAGGSAPACDADMDGHIADSCGGDDCDDTDADVHPGQTAWFTVKSKSGSFDYDCSTAVEHEYLPLKCPSLLGIGCDNFTPGYLDATVSCGKSCLVAHCKSGTLSCDPQPGVPTLLGCH